MSIKSYNTAIIFSGLITICMLVAGYFILSGGDVHRIWRSILINYLFFTPATAGLVVWPAIVVASNGKWMGSLERFCRTGISFAIPSLIGLIILWKGSTEWAPWLHSEKAWLDNTFLFTRNFIALTVFWILALLFMGYRNTGKRVVAAGWLIIMYAITFSLMGFDFVMALEPKWYSMMAGGYFFISGLYTAAAAWALLSAILEKPLKKEGLHDIGKLVLTFCMLTSYLMFSQLLPIWYENLPDETIFLIARMNFAWKGIGYLLLGIIYLGPVIILLSRELKRNPVLMTWVSLIILAGMWIERWWLVSAVFEKHQVLFGWYEIIPAIVFAGLTSAGVLVALKYLRFAS